MREGEISAGTNEEGDRENKRYMGWWIYVIEKGRMADEWGM